MAYSDWPGGAYTYMDGVSQDPDNWLDQAFASYDRRLDEEEGEPGETLHSGDGDEATPNPATFRPGGLLTGSKRRSSSSSESPAPAIGPVYGREIHFSLAHLDGRSKKRARVDNTTTAQALSLSLSTGVSSKVFNFITENPAKYYKVVVTAPLLRGDASSDTIDSRGQSSIPDRRQEVFATKTSGKEYVRQMRQNIEFTSAPDADAPLPDCYGGAVEMLTYLPHTTMRPSFGIRLRANGLSNEEIAKIQLHARGQASRENIHRRDAAVRRQMLNNGKQVFDDKNFTFRGNKHKLDLKATTDFDVFKCSTLPSHRHPRTPTAAPRLIDLAKDVVNAPSAEDSGLLTQAIRYAVGNNDSTLTTADVRSLALREYFVLPLGALSLTSNWDAEGRDRVLASMVNGDVDASEDSETNDEEGGEESDGEADE
ncbi:hypothetical protein LTR01_008244 [Friedmanniomyces endolithicus]|nr:hypothetical protein LTS09_014918 [Friedmanniomyces endolithicus]KAK0303234.1 hypothetical protein LTR01_008244 [Friedmanniomyces endolithicus]